MADEPRSSSLDKFVAMFDAFATEDNMVSRALMEEMERRKDAGAEGKVAATRRCLWAYVRGTLSKEDTLYRLVELGQDEGVMGTFLSKPVEMIRMQLESIPAAQASDPTMTLCDRCGNVLTHTGNINPRGMGSYTMHRCLKCDHEMNRGTIEDGVVVTIEPWDMQYRAILTNGKQFHGERESLIYQMFSASPEARAFRQRFIFDNNPPEPPPDPAEREYPRGALILPLP